MKGQLLIEILVGLAIITSVLVTSMVVITHATRLARSARSKGEATSYAQKVIEAYRNTRDQNKEAFFANGTCNNPCGTFGSNNMYSCTMTCVFSPAGAATQVDVTVTMTWDDGGVNVSVVLLTILTKYDL